jgi:hypothetical protein
MAYSDHTFHIPVMGLAFTVNTPVKVAPYGISSVISIIEDSLIERMREYYYNQLNELYIPIPMIDADHRIKRITDYLNLVNRMVHDKFEHLKAVAFEKGSEIVKYFEMLPDSSKLKQLYQTMLEMKDGSNKEALQQQLREVIKPGCIDVNIMTKLDNNRYDKEGNMIAEGSDALTALKGYAASDLSNSSVIFSAGMNPRLYNYIERFDEFRKVKDGIFEKRIIIKVSDYRSSLIQGKYLAKKGLWVSEFRIESGLNCGGHAFATDGFLLGPILEEFKNKKAEMCNELFALYSKALQEKGKEVPEHLPYTRITVQGGIGTAEEDSFIRKYYGVDGTGWGSPFLLVPEATMVDADTLEKLCNSKEEDIILSRYSPLGIRFNYLNDTTGEKEKFYRIETGLPGSPCPEKFLESNTEFTERPICTASSKYQKLKLEQIDAMDLSIDESQKQRKLILDKECLCLGLSNAATNNCITKPILKSASGVTICPGPNIAYFSQVVSLKTMADHIYGRTNILTNGYRPNMFLKELQLYVNYLKEQVEENAGNTDPKKLKFLRGFYSTMAEGICYYRQLLLDKIIDDDNFLQELPVYEAQLHTIMEGLLVAETV